MGGSSTDDDLYSFSSDDDHVIFTSSSRSDVMSGNHLFEKDLDDTSESLDGDLPNEIDEEEDEEEEDEDMMSAAEKGNLDDELNSQDWEVQMLARQLAQEQRGVARRIDRDIASGRLQSPLAELHEALATDNLNNLTELDLLRLEKIVRKERERLRQYARMYSLDERPVLEDEFTSLYRSRSQMLLSKSSELCRAGPTERRLSTLLKQLTTLPPSEQFLLDRLVYKSSRSRLLNRQQSLCDERLASYDAARSMQLTNRAAAYMRRSHSVSSPPPDMLPFTRQSFFSPSPPLSTLRRDPQGVQTIGEESVLIFEEENGSQMQQEEPQRVSAMLDSLQRSVAPLGGRIVGGGEQASLNDLSPPKEVQPLLRPSR